MIRKKPTRTKNPKSKDVKEIEAGSVSYVVCQKYGIETGDNSFGYLATWSNHDKNEVTASLDVIRKEASNLINAIDDQLKAVCKERGIDLTQSEQAQPDQQTQEQPSEPTQAAEQSSAPQEPPTQSAETPPIEPTFTTTSTTENIAGVDFAVNEIVPTVPQTIEQQNYQKLSELFPQITSGEFQYQRSEAGAGFMPLSLAWIDTDKLSIMHTYTQNGDLMYDPMIALQVDQEAQTATAVEFQQSNPPLYQLIDEELWSCTKQSECVIII